MGKLTGSLLMLLAMPMAAQQLSLSAYLKSALSHTEYNGFEAQQQLLSDEKAYRLPWVNELTFRTQNNGLQGYKQQYALRVNAGNPWQIKRNNSYFKAQRDLLGLEREMVLKEILADRYMWAIEVFSSGAEFTLAQKEQKMATKLADTWKQKSGSPTFDADQFLEAQLQAVEVAGNVLEKELEAIEAKYRIAVSVNSVQPIEWDANQLITVEEIENFIQSNQGGDANMHIKVLRQKLLLAEQKLKVEQANFDIGFLQAMYVPLSKDDVGFVVPRDRPLGISLGVNIPVFKPNKDNIARSQLNLIEAKTELSEAEGNTVEATLVQQFLLAQIRNYKALHALVAELVARELNQLAGVANNYDPVVDLEYQLKLIDLQKQEIRLKSRILKQFVAWLSATDQLQKTPLINYLERGMPAIEN